MSCKWCKACCAPLLSEPWVAKPVYSCSTIAFCGVCSCHLILTMQQFWLMPFYFNTLGQWLYFPSCNLCLCFGFLCLCVGRYHTCRHFPTHKRQTQLLLPVCCWCIHLTRWPNSVDPLVLCNRSGYDISGWSAGDGLHRSTGEWYECVSKTRRFCWCCALCRGKVGNFTL